MIVYVPPLPFVRSLLLKLQIQGRHPAAAGESMTDFAVMIDLGAAPIRARRSIADPDAPEAGRGRIHDTWMDKSTLDLAQKDVALGVG